MKNPVNGTGCGNQDLKLVNSVIFSYGLDNFSICNCMLRLCYAMKKQVFQTVTPFGSQIQTDHALFYA